MVLVQNYIMVLLTKLIVYLFFVGNLNNLFDEKIKIYEAGSGKESILDVKRIL